MTPQLYAEWGQKKFGSVGRPFAGAQLRVVDPETGVVLPPGKEGLLEVISPRIGPNWIRTSDIVILDEDGFLFHKGRADGAIMRGGFKLLPDTIERALKLHNAVSAAGVTGVADKRLGQVPAAAIQLKPGVATADHRRIGKTSAQSCGSHAYSGEVAFRRDATLHTHDEGRPGGFASAIRHSRDTDEKAVDRVCGQPAGGRCEDYLPYLEPRDHGALENLIAARTGVSRRGTRLRGEHPTTPYRRWR